MKGVFPPPHQAATRAVAGLCPQFLEVSLDPWNFPRDWSVSVIHGGPHLIVYANEMTQDGGCPARKTNL